MLRENSHFCLVVSLRIIVGTDHRKWKWLFSLTADFEVVKPMRKAQLYTPSHYPVKLNEKKIPKAIRNR
jgi:hypothetical protein